MKNIIKWGEPIIQAVISLLLLFLLISSGFLPSKYLGVAVVIVLLFLAITFLTARSQNTAARSIGGIFAIIICVLLIIASVYLHQVMNTLDQISSSNTQLDSYIVAVADRNPAQSIEDVSGYKFGTYEGAEGGHLEKMVEEVGILTGDDTLQTESFASSLDLANALLDGTIDAAICNQAYTAIVDDAIPDFSSKIRILYEREFETDIDGATARDKDHTNINRGEGHDTALAKNISLTEDTYTILISGIDVSGPINTTSRSDVNILMTINPRTHKILLTTTPRDYFVVLPGVSSDARDKLTHAGVYGVRTSIRTLEKLYGIEISNYVRINFDSLVLLVDALGGVDVESEVEFDGGKYHFVKGTNHLDGDQALAFSRARYAFEEGDNQRGKNQLLVLTAILNKLQSPALLKNPSGVLDVVSQSMQTSISSKQISEVISWQLANGKGWEISRQAVTGTPDSQETFSMPGTVLSVMWPDEMSVFNATQKIIEIQK